MGDVAREIVEENSVTMDRPPCISPQVADALEHLASTDLLELCKEAKVERCRATRDLSSCGRYVQDVLKSCGHASLCAECSKRCDMCPICRTSIPNDGNRLQPRLYYECANAGLISKRYDERFQEKDNSKDHFLAIQRLYFLFDVALDNSLVSLICHYVTDVCMDESAVSSDPVLSFLLDEVVVKDWCKQRFKGIIHDLQIAYRLDMKGMKSNLCSFQKLALQSAGISNVLEVMVSSFKDNLPSQLNDLHFLLDNTMKTKQHLEIMIWCIHHEFLENIQSHYPNDQSWALHVQERKSKAIKQSWPNSSSYLAYYGGQSEPALFIEQALSNLEIEESYGDEHDDIDISCLKDSNSPLLFSSKINESYRNQALSCYPFNHARTAADIIFLHGASDMVVAKRAIFLYYLFDRHWTLPDAEWRFLVDDFASSFGISRVQLLESFVFYLLDDHSDQALQEACSLLPEIAGSDTHSKIVQVLLERQHPYVALSVLRYTGRDGGRVVLLDEAVTVLRVRIECGLLTEAFMYIRLHCYNLKELKPKQGELSSSNCLKSDLWIRHMEVLVTEMCSLCMRRNLVDRVIEFPWDSTEEKYIHNCLLQHARQNPSSNYGSHLVVFYLQRFRYIEAYHVHRELQNLEQSGLENLDEEVAFQMKSMCHWRSLLLEKCLNLLPEDQRNQVITSNTTETDVESASEAQLNLTNVSSLSRKLPSLVLHTDSNYFASTNTLNEASIKQYTSFGNAHKHISSNVSSDVQQSLLTSFGSPHNGSQVMPLKELNANPLRIPGFVQQSIGMGNSNETRSYDSAIQFEESSKPSPRKTCRISRDLVNISSGQNHMIDAVNNHHQRCLVKQDQLDDGPWSMITSEESTQNVWSIRKSDSPAEQSSMKVGLRWRSDESSEDEVDQIDKHLSGASTFTLRRRTRHFSRRQVM